MWNFKSDLLKIKIQETDEHMGVGGKRERETSHKRLLTIENKLRVDGVMWVGDGLDG